MDPNSVNNRKPSTKPVLSWDKILSHETSRKADVISIESIYQKYHGSVFRVCLGLLKSKEDAEDATHEVFMAIMRKISSFKGESGLFTWIYAIAINASLQIMKKKKRHEAGHLVTELPDPEGLYRDTQIDAKNAINWLFETSNHRTQLFLLLRYANGLTQEEVGEVLSIDPRTVRSIEKKIGRKLRHSRYRSIR